MWVSSWETHLVYGLEAKVRQRGNQAKRTRKASLWGSWSRKAERKEGFPRLSPVLPSAISLSPVLLNVDSTGWKKTARSRAFTVLLFIKIIDIIIVIKSNYRYHKKENTF